MEDKFLEQLKAGDEVIVIHPSFGRNPRTVERIERVTKIHIMVDRKCFRRRDGWQVGEGHHRAWLAEATAEAKAEIRDERETATLVNKLEAVKWRSLGLPLLRRVSELVTSAGRGDRDDTPESSLPA